MLSIIEEYNRLERERKAERDAIDKKIEKAEEEIERAKRRIKRLQKKYDQFWIKGTG